MNKETPEQELREKLFNMAWQWFKDNRFYCNWRTTDQKDSWTAKDFTLVTPENSAGSLAMEVGLLVSTLMKETATHYKAREAEIRLDFAQAIMFTKVEALFDDGELFQQWQPIEQTIINQVGYESFKALQEAAGNLDLNKDSKS